MSRQILIGIILFKACCTYLIYNVMLMLQMDIFISLKRYHNLFT